MGTTVNGVAGPGFNASSVMKPVMQKAGEEPVLSAYTPTDIEAQQAQATQAEANRIRTAETQAIQHKPALQPPTPSNWAKTPWTA